MEYAVLAIRFALGIVFVLASIPKLVSPQEFVRAVANYQLLPFRLARPVGVWLPRLELLVALLLLAGIVLPLAAALVAAMLTAFSVAVTVNLLRGRRIECGCGGITAPKRIGPALVVRNVVLAGAAGVLAARSSGALAVPGLSLARGSTLTSAAALAVLFATVVAVVAGAALADAVRARGAAEALLARVS